MRISQRPPRRALGTHLHALLRGVDDLDAKLAHAWELSEDLSAEAEDELGALLPAP
jgi:hypothetical protein